MKFYAWMVRYQDVISGFVAGICLMSAADYFARGNVSYGCLSLLISVVNLFMVTQRIGEHGKSN